ncbi:MAG: hypothetical protein AB8H80_07220 [Planctomycetota bacterium]
MNNIAPTFLKLTLLAATTSILNAQEWVLESSTTNPSGTTYATASASPNGAGVVLFEGINGAGRTLEWVDGSWTDLAPINSPPARFGAAMSLLNGAVLFGGVDNASGAVLNDTWLFDGTDWQQAVVAGPVPPARWGHAMATIDESGLVMYGGVDANNVLLNDTWIWNGATWTLVPVDGPTPRHLHAMCLDPSTPLSAFMYGGSDLANNTMADTWRFTTNPGPQWVLVQANAAPGPRAAHSLTFDSARNQAVLLGGKVDVATPSSGLTAWNFNGTWTAVTTAGNQPVADTIHAHAAAFDSAAAEHVTVSLNGGTRTYGSPAGNRPAFTSSNSGCGAVLEPNGNASPGLPFIDNNFEVDCVLSLPAGANEFGLLIVNASINQPALTCGRLSPAGGQYFLSASPAGTTRIPFAVPIPNDPTLVGLQWYAEGMTIPVATLMPTQVSDMATFSVGIL